MAGLYVKGTQAFFEDWQEFTESSTPLLVNPVPRLVLVAQEFDPRTAEALAFLQETGSPVDTVPVSLYGDGQNNRLVHVDTDTEPEAAVHSSTGTGIKVWKLGGRRFEVGDLLAVGMVEADEPLVWRRARSGTEYHAKVTAEGRIELNNGQQFDTPSGAAIAASGVNAVPGWGVWRLPNRENRLLMDLRSEYFAKYEQGDG